MNYAVTLHNSHDMLYPLYGNAYFERENMYYPRSLSSILKSVSETFPVLFITGPRQVGKTTLFEQALTEERRYVTFDDPRARSLAKEDPVMFFQTYPPPLFLDEMQYVPEIFPYIKMIVDREKKKGLFWMTGSQQFPLMKGLTESLAGRVALLNLQGLSQAEKLQRESAPFSTALRDGPPMTVSQVYAMILRGSYPALFADERTSWRIFYDSYIKTYVERDVRTIMNITDEHKFLKFLSALAARTGQLLNYAEVSKEIEVSLNTIKAWISVLETSGLVYLLKPYHTNRISRLVKTPKIYFLDTGLCCALSGWETVETLSTGAMSGAMLETYVFSEIVKSFWHNGENPSLFFYRDTSKREIDVLLEKDGTLFPIEVKKKAMPTAADVKNFPLLRDHGLPVGTGAVVCFSDRALPLNRYANVIPVSSL